MHEVVVKAAEWSFLARMPVKRLNRACWRHVLACRRKQARNDGEKNKFLVSVQGIGDQG